MLLGLEGQDCVEGHLHEWRSWYADLALGAVLVLDSEYGNLQPYRRHFGNGFGPANRMTDAANFAVPQLDEGLLVLQELFVIKGVCHRIREAKDILIPSKKVCLGVCIAGHCKRGVGSRGQGVDKGWCRLLIDGSNRVVDAVVVLLLNGAESNGSNELIR